MKALVWRDVDEKDLGAKYEITDIPADMVDQANEYREAMMETIATQTKS
jgi:elongation factor G